MAFLGDGIGNWGQGWERDPGGKLSLNFIKEMKTNMWELRPQLYPLVYPLWYNTELETNMGELRGQFYPLVSGLGIRSSVFQVNRSIFAQKWANERFAQKNERFTHSLIFGERNEQFAHITHFLWATWANHSWSLIFGEGPQRFTHIAHQKRGNERFVHFLNKQPYVKHTKKQYFRFF